MKRIFSIVLCLLLTALLPLSAGAAELTGRDSVRYDTNGGYILVDKNTGELIYADPGLTGDVVIPGSVSGVTITSILYQFPYDAFDDQNEYVAFSGCDNITSLTLPGTVESVVQLGHMKNLRSLVLQEGVKSFSTYSFSSPAIKEIVLPKSLAEITGGALGNMQVDIMLNEENPYFVMGEQNILYSKDRTVLVAAFGQIDGEYTIPDTVLTIGKHAFSGNTQISSITIPANVQKVGTQSFMNCTGLLKVTFDSKSVSIVTEAFMGCTALQEVQFPSEQVTLGTSVFADCSALQSVSLPPKGSLGLRSFTRSGLIHISIPADYTLTAFYTFEDCKQLETAIFRDGFQEALYGTFEGCDALESVRVPETVPAMSVFYPSNEFGTNGPADVIIKGKRGSVAGRYAKQNMNIFESEGDVPLPFTDSGMHWAKSDIEWAYYNYIMDGVSPDRFSPDKATSRAMFVTMLKRLDRNDASYRGNDAMDFTDVVWHSYYRDAVYWAADRQITNGTAPSAFSPNSNIRREDMVVMLMRYAEQIGMDTSERGELSAFGDAASVSGYAQQAVQWAVSQDILQGNSTGSLKPQASATRAETAAMLRRFSELVDQKQIFHEDGGAIQQITLRSYSDNLLYTMTGKAEIQEFCDGLNRLQYTGVTENYSNYPGTLSVNILYKNESPFSYKLDLYASRIEKDNAVYTLKEPDPYLEFIAKWAEKLEKGIANYN